MLCPNCHGTRFVTTGAGRLPCPECGGMGEVHCCDGLQEQLDPAADAGPAADPPTPAATNAPARGTPGTAGR